MTETTLSIAAAFAVVTATVFVFVARRVIARRVEGDAQLAGNLFGVWWFALAGVAYLDGLTFALAAADRLGLALLVAVQYLKVFLICLGLFGLLFYLVYLYTGKRNMVYPLAGGYIVYYAAIVYFLTSHEPVGVRIAEWNVGIDYATELAASPILTVLILLLVVPQILASFAYFLLYFRVDTAAQRFRIVLVSWAILIWFSSALIASFTGLSGAAWWPLASRIIALSAALTVLLAFSPPKWVRERYGIAANDPPEQIEGVDAHA